MATLRRDMRTRLAIASASLLLLVACGTRLPDEDFVAAGVAAGAPEGGATGTTVRGATGPAPAGGTATTAAPGATVPGGGPAPAPGGEGAAPTDPGAAPAGPNQASDVGVTETTIRIGS